MNTVRVLLLYYWIIQILLSSNPILDLEPLRTAIMQKILQGKEMEVTAKTLKLLVHSDIIGVTTYKKKPYFSYKKPSFTKS